MKTLIVYSTKHGSTKICVEKIKKKLNTDTDIINLKENKNPHITGYDTIIIGGSIYAGRIQKHIQRFCTTNEKTLLQKKIGLFICCMYEGDQAQQQFRDAFLKSLRKHAAAHGILGGVLDFDKMNFLEKTVVKKVAGVQDSQFNISENNINTFISDLQKS